MVWFSPRSEKPVDCQSQPGSAPNEQKIANWTQSQSSQELVSESLSGKVVACLQLRFQIMVNHGQVCDACALATVVAKLSEAANAL